MILTKDTIAVHKDNIPGLDGYSRVISKIEENITTNPDIAIESCKSLIEGLCKKALELVSDKYNSDKRLRGLCENNMKDLVKTAFNHVYSNGLEANMHESLYHIIQQKTRTQTFIENAQKSLYLNSKSAIDKIAAIRHDRGDLSHGRIYPKKIESEIHLAKSIASITDGICSFMIHEFSRQYEIKAHESKKLVYDEWDEFNTWLDQQNDTLTTKVDFSRLLYSQTYEKYEEIFFGEYLDFIEAQAEDQEVDEKEDVKPEEIPDSPVRFRVKPKEKLLEHKFEWDKKKLKLVKQFAKKEKLDVELLKLLIDQYLLNEKFLDRDEAIKTLLEKPSLQDRAVEGENIKEKIIAFVNSIK
ncbi:hypothetical protein GCQ56_08175 [Marinifilum sp. N1E240]|uniref:hypothetical protein n=1 Tax=Marinifilum sp. N1E240 TaxID=2608082 RepID=UPI00128B0D2C|nr:hypothetical protein [Marinifilum sp. N1E240]MPQ46991.1 hypothetical protein [Marinifilum sp. N1E240]